MHDNTYLTLCIFLWNVSGCGCPNGDSGCIMSTSVWVSAYWLQLNI